MDVPVKTLTELCVARRILPQRPLANMMFKGTGKTFEDKCLSRHIPLIQLSKTYRKSTDLATHRNLVDDKICMVSRLQTHNSLHLLWLNVCIATLFVQDICTNFLQLRCPCLYIFKLNLIIFFMISFHTCNFFTHSCHKTDFGLFAFSRRSRRSALKVKKNKKIKVALFYILVVIFFPFIHAEFLSFHQSGILNCVQLNS